MQQAPRPPLPMDRSPSSSTSTGRSSSRKTRETEHSSIGTGSELRDLTREVSRMIGDWEDCEHLVRDYFVRMLKGGITWVLLPHD